MDYQVPTCECGTVLVLEEVWAVHERQKINVTGKASKKISKLSGNIVHEKRLICSECCNIYEYQNDKNGRYLRGEKYEVSFQEF